MLTRPRATRSRVAPLLLATACAAEPRVEILEPVEGAGFTDLSPVRFLAVATDPDGADDLVAFRWTDEDGRALARGTTVPADGILSFDATFPPGPHTVRLSVEDGSGAAAWDEVRFDVRPGTRDPDAVILAPAALATFREGERVALAGFALDGDDAPDALRVTWSYRPYAGGAPVVVADGDGAADGATEAAFTPPLPGRYRIGLEATDPSGRADRDEVSIQVVRDERADGDGDGFTPRRGDCDDTDPSVHPGAEERCGDAGDDDCDGLADDRDADLDGHVDAACAATTTGPEPADDCDDTDPTVFAGAPEAVNGVDEDCDGDPDDGTVAWDADGDCFCAVAPCAGSADAGCATLGGLDCDDADDGNAPGAAEVCDGRDNDCDGVPDDGLEPVAWYPDVDGDGWGAAASAPVLTCDGPPDGAAPTAADCDDADAAVHPGVVEVECNGIDDDCDPATPDGPDADGDGVAGCLDCDDANPLNFPGNPEQCDQRDNDCSGIADEGLPWQTWYQDGDGDGAGDPTGVPVVSCGPVRRAVPNDDDCDDTRALVAPGLPEVTCDGVENDCDPGTPDAPDLDGDGASTCGDCDDADPWNRPGAAELCDGQDNDCDGAIDEDLTFVDWWPDLDGDGHGDPTGIPVRLCAQAPVGYAGPADDCDDADPDNHPGNPERCDGRDQDCTGAGDDGLAFVTWWVDQDGDGAGDPLGPSATTCDGPPDPTWVADRGDCDDSDDRARPGNAELRCNGVDDDCLGQTEDDPDEDLDGFPACLDCDDGDPDRSPGLAEVCDGIDQDCDGAPDDGLPFADAWRDRDADGYGDPRSVPVSSCDGPPRGRVANAADCDDADFDVNPGHPELTCDGIDNDCRWATQDAPDRDGDGVSTCDDCRDLDPDVFPGQAEVCDGVDNDCDGARDDGLLFTDWWPDGDGDGAGDPGGARIRACAAPAGHAGNAADCDDGDAAVAPGAPEAVADGVDQDCDGVDLCWLDQDGDGVGGPIPTPATAVGCAGPLESVRADDCDDADPDNRPGNDERCDGRDNNCLDGPDDHLDFVDVWPDADGDGFGDGTAAPLRTCLPPAGTVPNGADCDDARDDVHPGAPEVGCDGVDQDCDAGTPDVADADGDGADTCDDCDDADPGNVPGGVEACDGRDNDCSGSADDGLPFVRTWPDQDGDGWGDPGGAAEDTCAGIPAGRIDNDLDCDDAEPALGADDLDGDGWSACDGDCDDADAGTHPGASDEPDGGFADEDCDGVDGRADDAAFASPEGSDLGNDVCTRARPCRTLDHAVQVAGALGLPHVYVQAGAWLGGVLLDQDVAVFGGFDADWVRGPNTEPAHAVVLYGGFVTEDEAYETVRVRGAAVGLHDLQIVGPDAATTDGRAGHSSYAVHADEGSAVLVERCVIVSGRGADGLDGTPGADASVAAAPSAVGIAGAAAGAGGSCSTDLAVGGAGGTNRGCTLTGGGRGRRGGRADSVCCADTCDETCGDCAAQRGGQGTDGAQAYTIGAGAYWYRVLDADLVPTTPVESVAWTDATDVVPPDSAPLPDGFAVVWIDQHHGAVPDTTVMLSTWSGSPPTRTHDRVLANAPGAVENRPFVEADALGRMALAWVEVPDGSPRHRAVLAYVDADGRFLMPPLYAATDATDVVIEFLDDAHVVVAWEGAMPGTPNHGVYVSVRAFPGGEIVYPPTLISDVAANAERPALGTYRGIPGRPLVGVSWEQTSAAAPDRAVHGVVVGFEL